MASNLFDISPRPDHAPLQANSMGTYPSQLPAIGPKTAKTGRSQLGVGFEPSDFSVICGRSFDNHDHTGNRCFRIIASTFLDRYSEAFSQTSKAAVVFNIVTVIRQVGGNFCKYEKGAWFEVGDRCARAKASYLLRVMLHTRNQSSSEVKIALSKARGKDNEAHTQQDEQLLVDGTGHWDDLSLCSGSIESSTDSLGFEDSLEIDFDDLSSCSGSIGNSTDSLGFEDSLEIDFFDIEVF
jgi:hypothetical protein